MRVQHQRQAFVTVRCIGSERKTKDVLGEVEQVTDNARVDDLDVQWVAVSQFVLEEHSLVHIVPVRAVSV